MIFFSISKQWNLFQISFDFWNAFIIYMYLEQLYELYSSEIWFVDFEIRIQVRMKSQRMKKTLHRILHTCVSVFKMSCISNCLFCILRLSFVKISMEKKNTIYIIKLPLFQKEINCYAQWCTGLMISDPQQCSITLNYRIFYLYPKSAFYIDKLS